MDSLAIELGGKVKGVDIRAKDHISSSAKFDQVSSTVTVHKGADEIVRGGGVKDAPDRGRTESFEDETASSEVFLG